MEWRAGTTASRAKGGRPPSLAYSSRTWPIGQVALAYRRYTAVVPGGSTTTPLAGVTQCYYSSFKRFLIFA